MPSTLIQAIARMEGFYVPNTRASRNNNPGNIEYGEIARSFGATLEDHAKPRFAEFTDVVAGFDCLRTLLQNHYAGLTIEQAINKYAPHTENDTTNYVQAMCEWCNVEPSTILTNEIIG